MPEYDARALALRALPLLDLTDLNDESSRAAVKALCARTQTPHGHVAAVCIWSRFVGDASVFLAGSDVRIATVVNFPGGDQDITDVIDEAHQAISDGADEIDLVMPYEAWMSGDRATAEATVIRVRSVATPPVKLKVILETGRLKDPALIREASDMAIAAGADFIKTSTGKVDVNATPEAARIMLEAIRASGAPVGFKPAGGIRTLDDAAAYLALADEIMGPDWVSPETFRFGASSLLDALLAAIDGGPAITGDGY
ncbi:deoxyribose-phosphate aldolase [Breoghania sp.]|uniref:deoxyribose-phosphate aldolase n=1 Tax=Breoghania sp. TaxID=2065378 RepID=UPI002AA8CA76|nr:deoxyribose-phosphate aldolase [Breoghania sp.]